MDPVTQASSTPSTHAEVAVTAGDWSGKTLGDFHLLRRLGQGGMGQVYLAEQLSLKRKVAIKMLPAKSIDDAQAKRRLFREARAAATLGLTETDSTHTGAGSVGFTYSAADSSFDFLAAGETLKVTYGGTVTDNHDASSIQPVTITITGTNDAPVLAVDSSGVNGPVSYIHLALTTIDPVYVQFAAGTLTYNACLTVTGQGGLRRRRLGGPERRVDEA